MSRRPTVFVCQGSRCRRADGCRDLADCLTPVADVEEVRCQRVCDGPVVGTEGRWWRLPALAVLAVLWLPGAAAAAPSVVIRWNEAALEAVRATRATPVVTARALAIVHTAIFDAWAAYDDRAVGTRYGTRLRRPPSERTDQAREEAISHAAYRALVDLFPSERERVIDPLMVALGYDPGLDFTGLDTPAGIGQAAAAAVLAYRHVDGANQLGTLSPGAYADYTGYAPVNTPEEILDPNRWQPLRNADGSTQRFLAPHWGLVVPFAFTPRRPLPPPPAFGTRRYRDEADEVVALSQGLTDRQKAIAVYWADGPSTETPPGHWNLMAQWVSARDRHTLDDDVVLFFALGNALLDASVAVWECKRDYDYVRPISAVRHLHQGRQIRAWAGPYRGTEVMAGESFTPYIQTPPFAEYVSGHSTFSAAAAEILRLFTGSDRFGATAVVVAGSSPIEPGAVPASDVVLRWPTFSSAADEAGMSRRYGGIHFRSGDLQGRSLGRLVAGDVWKQVLRHRVSPGRPGPRGPR